MRVPSGAASRARNVICPFCESGERASVGPGFARCGSCGLPLLGSVLDTLWEIVGLPDALAAHPCECGHPEMRDLPDGVYYCPACGSEVLPLEDAGGGDRGPDDFPRERRIVEVRDDGLAGVEAASRGAGA